MAYRRANLGDKGNNLFGGITAGTFGLSGGSTLSKLSRGTFTVDTSSIAQFARETGTFNLSGATTGDLVLCMASTSLNAGIILEGVAICTATSVITVGFVNHSSAAVVQTSGLVNHYVHLRLA
jgi:hypothetical protein